MAVSVTNGDAYLNNLLNAEAWASADNATKGKALNSAELMLYRHYRQYDKTTTPLPDEAVYEQALFMLANAEGLKHAEQNVSSYNIDGISVNYKDVNRTLAPSVVAILGRRVGKSSSGRDGYIFRDYPTPKG